MPFSVSNVLPSPHKVLLLVFGLPKDMDAKSMDVRAELVNSAWNSSLEFVSTFDYECKSSRCTVLLSKARMASFNDKGYEVGLLNTSAWNLQSLKIPCSAMRDVGDVDKWDKTVEVPQVKGRRLLDSQVDSWRAAMFPPIGMSQEAHDFMTRG